MKTLTLLRHAKSGWDDTVARDFDRPLNGKGRRAAECVGRHLRDSGAVYDAVIASPAMRVRETIAGVEAGYHAALNPAFDQRIYLAAAETLLDVVRGLSDSATTALLIGHNPGLEDLVLMLVPDDPDDLARDEVEEKYPTASVAVLRFDVDRWADVRENGAELVLFTRPRDLDPSLGPNRD